MDFRWSQRDDRRRRVLMDETDSEESSTKRPRKRAPARSKKAVEDGPRYTSEARSDRQLQLLDILPKRLWLLAVLLVTAIACVAVLNVIHVQALRWGYSASALAALDLTAPASLGTWLASVILIVGAIVSLQIYDLRRHKVTDYRGRYRVWLWAAAAFLLASIDATTQLHVAASEIIARASGTTLYGDGSIWWLLVFGLPALALGIRMLIEMRQSRGAVATTVLAAASYTCAGLVKLDLMTVPQQAAIFATTWTLATIGHLMLLFAALFYVRYVYLDAHGQLRVRRTKSKKASSGSSEIQPSDVTTKQLIEAEETASNINSRLDREQLVKFQDELDKKESKTRKKRKSKQSQYDISEMQDEHDGQQDGNRGRRMSKAERKRMKRDRQQRRAA